MTITPTVFTAAAAGIVSGLSWPLLRPLFQDTSPTSSMWLVLGMLVFVALPAHAGVVGFARAPKEGSRSVDTPLLKRTAVWLLAAAVTAWLMSQA